jgi:hypothetical protein
LLAGAMEAMHPNLLRYYGRESDANFVYLASDLCATTLHALVESSTFNPFMHDYSVNPVSGGVHRGSS